MYTKTTKKQLEMIFALLLEDRWTDKAIADKAGVSVRVVWYYKRTRGFTDGTHRSYHYSKWNEESAREASRIWRETHSIEALTSHFGVQENSLRVQMSKLRKKGIYAPYLYKAS